MRAVATDCHDGIDQQTDGQTPDRWFRLSAIVAASAASIAMLGGGYCYKRRDVAWSVCPLVRHSSEPIGGSRDFLEGVTLGTRAREASEH